MIDRQIDVYYYLEIVKYWKQYKWPFAWESINKPWYSYTMKYAMPIKI